MTPLLEVRDVTKSYGGVVALARCSLAITRPGIYGLIGPNGAGKTTLFDVITGATDPDDGFARWDGRDTTRIAAHRLPALGIARSFQECRIFPEFGCLENLLFATQRKRLSSSLRQILSRELPSPSAREEAMRMLSLVNLERYAHEPAGTLSFGQRRLLEIVVTFLVRPGLLMLDEPASGVNPALLDTLSTFLRARYEERPAVFLIVEHNMEFIMALADEIIVMHQGAVLERGSAQAIQSSSRVAEAYLG